MYSFYIPFRVIEILAFNFILEKINSKGMILFKSLYLKILDFMHMKIY